MRNPQNTNPQQFQGNPNQNLQTVNQASQPIQSFMPTPPVTQTMTMHVQSRTSILLQTAKGYISSPTDQSRKRISRLIFDTGSKHSYISSSLRDALQLLTISQETIEVKVFGGDAGTIQTCDVVQFCVRSSYTGLCVYVTAYVVPILCSPLSEQPIKFAASNYPHLAGLCLADSQAEINQELDCEILIGSNYYWRFMSGRGIIG